MKFNIKIVQNCARLGYFCGEGLSIDTPAFILITRGGTVPHLTYEVLKRVTEEQMILQLPLGTSIEAEKILENLKIPFSEFCGLSEYPFYLSVNDPSVPRAEGYTTKQGVSVWTRHGRVLLEPKRLMKIVNSYRPMCYQVLCDSETNDTSGCKRISNSIERSLKFSESCLKAVNVIANDSVTPKPWITLVGGYDLPARKKYAKEVSLLPSAGFVVEGFHGNGNLPNNINKDAIATILKNTFPLLPEDKPRVLPGAWSPDFVLDFVKQGVDLIDSSFLYLVTERGAALNFLFGNRSKLSIGPDSLGDQMTKDDEEYSSLFEMSLWETRYFDDFSPLVENCDCYSCINYTRSYVHHLLKTKEMLASTLLMMHNVHYYLQFFNSIRTAVRNETLETFIVSPANKTTNVK